MKSTLRYGDYLRAIGAGRREVSYNGIMPPVMRDEQGRPVPPPAPGPIRLQPDEIAGLLRPYVSVRFRDQLRAVVPLALYLALFQILILRQTVEDSWLITGGLVAVIVGLMLFMEGLKLGLMPFGEIIGHTLPRKSPLPLVLFITLLLGIGVTFAEPAIGALQAAGQNVSPERAPYLWALLNQWTDALVLVVGASVGLAAVLGTLRFLYGWSLKPLIYAFLVPVLGLTAAGATDPELAKVMGLAMSATAPCPPVPGGAARLISCILPDDGTEKRLLRALRPEKGITRANSVYCRGISMLREATARRGKLPEPALLRPVTIVVAAEEADALFDLIYEQADIDRPGGGALIMTPLAFATPFVLPEGVPDEAAG